MRGHRLLPLLLASMCFAAAPPVAATPVAVTPDNTPIDAIWQVKELDFRFFTPRRYHSCSSLHSKIKGVLGAVGAGHVAVRMNCSKDSLTDSTSAKILATLPVAATADNVRAATTFNSRDELVARLRDFQLPTANDIERFPAEWRTISLGRRPGLGIRAEDCELLHELSTQILPLLSVRVVRQNFRCHRMGAVQAPPTLIVEALTRTGA